MVVHAASAMMAVRFRAHKFEISITVLMNQAVRNRVVFSRKKDYTVIFFAYNPPQKYLLCANLVSWRTSSV